jgi:hypothetical protein
MTMRRRQVVPCHRALESLEILVRWAMKNALLAPPSLGGETSKRFSGLFQKV